MLETIYELAGSFIETAKELWSMFGGYIIMAVNQGLELVKKSLETGDFYQVVGILLFVVTPFIKGIGRALKRLLILGAILFFLFGTVGCTPKNDSLGEIVSEAPSEENVSEAEDVEEENDRYAYVGEFFKYEEMVFDEGYTLNVPLNSTKERVGKNTYRIDLGGKLGQEIQITTRFEHMDGRRAINFETMYQDFIRKNHYFEKDNRVFMIQRLRKQNLEEVKNEDVMVYVNDDNHTDHEQSTDKDAFMNYHKDHLLLGYKTYLAKQDYLEKGGANLIMADTAISYGFDGTQGVGVVATSDVAAAGELEEIAEVMATSIKEKELMSTVSSVDISQEEKVGSIKLGLPRGAKRSGGSTFLTAFSFEEDHKLSGIKIYAGKLKLKDEEKNPFTSDKIALEIASDYVSLNPKEPHVKIPTRAVVSPMGEFGTDTTYTQYFQINNVFEGDENIADDLVSNLPIHVYYRTYTDIKTDDEYSIIVATGRPIQVDQAEDLIGRLRVN